MSDEPAAQTDEKAGEHSEATEAPKHGDTVYVKIYAPYKVYFEGEANSISAASHTGPFDILPRHHNFITLLVACDVIVRTPTHEEKIRIQGGIMHVKADKVIVFLDV